MTIAICDDDILEAEQLEQLICAYALQKKYDLHCRCFTSGTELLKQKEKYNLYYLDYEMGDLNSLELAQSLKEKFHSSVTVCILTNYEDAVPKEFNSQRKTNAYLKKPIEPQLLYDMLEQWFRASVSEYLVLKTGKNFETVDTKEILYIEADGKRSTFHFFDHTKSYNYQLLKLESDLLHNVCFYRIHRSFIVNLQNVSHYDSKHVFLIDDTILPLKARKFRNIYKEYLSQSDN